VELGKHVELGNIVELGKHVEMVKHEIYEAPSFFSHRCDLTNEDLNRHWSHPNQQLHPSIYHTKVSSNNMTAHTEPCCCAPGGGRGCCAK